MPNPPLPIGGGPRGARGDSGIGSGERPASPGWVEPASGGSEETHARVDGIISRRATEAGRLSQLVVGISNALVDLGMLPIQDIAQLPESAQEVLTAAGLILDCLREEKASAANPWD
jgi:hypothetical protein